MVDMGDDGDIAEVFAASHLSTLRGGRALPEIGERAAMTFYADIPARRNRQILGDLWLVAWSALWIWAALRLYDLVMNLAAPGLALADGATSLSDSIANAGETVSFTVGATNATTFQWTKDGNPLPGATNATLTLVNVQPVNIGDYRVVVGNAAGSVTSSVAALNLQGVEVGI